MISTELTSIALLFLINELLIFVIFKQEGRMWKLRFGTNSYHLNPAIKTWKIAGGIFIINIIAYPLIFTPLFNSYIPNLISQFKYPVFLVITSFVITFLWIWRYTVGKKWYRVQTALLAGAILSFILFAYLNWPSITSSTTTTIKPTPMVNITSLTLEVNYSKDALTGYLGADTQNISYVKSVPSGSPFVYNLKLTNSGLLLSHKIYKISVLTSGFEISNISPQLNYTLSPRGGSESFNLTIQTPSTSYSTLD